MLVVPTWRGQLDNSDIWADVLQFILTYVLLRVTQNLATVKCDWDPWKQNSMPFWPVCKIQVLLCWGLNCRFYHSFRMEDYVGRLAGLFWWLVDRFYCFNLNLLRCLPDLGNATHKCSSLEETILKKFYLGLLDVVKSEVCQPVDLIWIDCLYKAGEAPLLGWVRWSFIWLVKKKGLDGVCWFRRVLPMVCWVRPFEKKSLRMVSEWKHVLRKGSGP